MTDRRARPSEPVSAATVWSEDIAIGAAARAAARVDRGADEGPIGSHGREGALASEPNGTERGPVA